MKIVWSLPIPSQGIVGSSRGDLVRAGKLIEALRHLGHEVAVVENSARVATRIAVSAYRGGVRRLLPRSLSLALRDLGRMLSANSAQGRLERFIRETRPDLVIETQVAFMSIAGRVARRNGIPLVLDDCSPDSEVRQTGSPVHALARRSLRRDARHAKALLVSTEAARQHLVQDGIDEKRLIVVPNGVDLEAYRFELRAETRRRLGLEGVCVMVFHGSYQPWHRVDLLVSAFGRLPRDDSLRLLLIGDGAGRAVALEAARKRRVESRVVDLGPVEPDAVPGLLMGCDIGVLPGTNSYGHPMKLLEYAAAELAIVAPDMRVVNVALGAPEVMLSFVPANEESLVRQLSLLIEDPQLRARLGKEARVRLATPATWERRARQILEAI